MNKGETKGWQAIGLALGLAVLLWPAVAGADELGDLKHELQDQKTRSADLENRINQLDARQKLKERSLNEKIDELAAKVEEAPSEAVIPDVLKWAAKMQWSGDFRYRYEYIDDGTSAKDRHRSRIRARLGLKAEVNDEWDFGLRVASGTADPVSTNQTLDEAFSSKPLWLDRAYFAYHPD
jgi:Putative porin